MYSLKVRALKTRVLKTRVLKILGLTVWLLAGGKEVQAFDLHAFWDSRCRQCHGHAAAFARSRLTVEAGALIGRHHTRDLKQFLGQHEMGPTHAEAMYAMLLAQAATTQPVFQQKCAGCHGPAAEFARASLVRKDGIIVGRASGQALATFLERHGGLRPDEVPIVVGSLVRVLGEVGDDHK